MLTTLFLFFLSAALIYGACEYFVNGVEWCGHRLQLGSMAVGSVLAAFGTALPESSVTLIAVLFGRTPAEKDLGVGAALGGPLVLSTLAYAIVGIALLLQSRSKSAVRVQAEERRIRRDQGVFLGLFAVGLLLGVTHLPGHSLFAIAFLLIYAVYVWRRMREESQVAQADELEPLMIRRRGNATLGWAAAQTLLALAVIGLASHLFVSQLGAIATALHWPTQMAALLLSPIATELPETMNALIWVRQGKERLALANISGAMMIQATIPSALGLFFTAWRFDRSLILSAGATLAATAFLWLLFRRGSVRAGRLAPVCIFYGIFALLLCWYFVHRWEHVPTADHLRQNPWAGKPTAVAAGEVAYRQHCMHCHGESANGDGGRHPSLRSAQIRKATDGDIDWFLRQGETGQGMPSWAALQDEDRWKIIRYLRSIQ